MKQEKENPPVARRVSEIVQLGGLSGSQINPTFPENQLATNYLVARFGLSLNRARLLADLWLGEHNHE